MKDAEKAIIENLRKTTLSHLSEYDYDVVIKEIEKYGITNLTGTTDKLVREAVNKHGSHNQSSHGRKGGGKGGGSAEAPKEFEDKLVEASEGLDNMIVGAQKLADNAKDRKSFDMARGAVKGFKDVQSALGDKKQMKAVRLKRNSKAAQIMKTPGSLAPLQEGYAENVGYVQGATSALAQYGDL